MALFNCFFSSLFSLRYCNRGLDIGKIGNKRSIANELFYRHNVGEAWGRARERERVEDLITKGGVAEAGGTAKAVGMFGPSKVLGPVGAGRSP